jgi:hypothetical protein
MGNVYGNMALIGLFGLIGIWVFCSMILLVQGMQKGATGPPVWLIEKSGYFVGVGMALEFGITLEAIVSFIDTIVGVIM